MLRCLGAIALSGMFLLAGCGSRSPVPVAERSSPVVVEAGPGGRAPAASAPTVQAPREGYYVVKKGDTLRRIAQEHNLDHRQLAAWNNLTDPNKLEVGQELRVAPPEGTAIAQPIAMPAPVTIVTEGGVPPAPLPSAALGTSETLKRDPKGGKVPYSDNALAEVRAMEGGARPARDAEKPADKPVPTEGGAVAPSGEPVDWTWPAGGKILGEFVEGVPGKESHKGIDIAGRIGEPIQAAGTGKVSFVGNLRGYGDFLVVRHNNDFISVYGHTSKILVKKDQTVSRGQKIAEIGSSDAEQPKLHFEIRQQGKPVDPLKLLPSR